MKAFAQNTNPKGASRQPSGPLEATPFFGVQAKLSVGKKDDHFEKEADHVADKVVQKSEQQPSFFANNSFFPKSQPSVQRLPLEEVQKQEETEEVQEKPLAASITPLVQLASDDNAVQEKCEACEAEETQEIQRLPFEEVQTKLSEAYTLQNKCEACEKEESVQRKASSEKQASGSIESRLQSSKGGGSTMAAHTMSQMQSGFGADFSQVRIHTDSNAVQLSKDLGAQAFTHGNDIYFNEGKYNPSSTSGQHLLAHELTHTIQQGGSASMAQNKIQRWPAWADSAVSWVADTATSAASSVAEGAAWVGGQVADGAAWVGDQVSAGVNWVGDQVSAAADWIIEQLNSAIDSGTDFLNEKWEAIESFGTSAFDDIKNGFGSLASIITSPMSIIVAALSDMNADILQSAWNLVKGGGNALMAGINSVINSVLNAGELLWGTVTGTIDGIFDTIDGLFNNSLFDLLPGFIKNGIRSAFNGLRSLWTRISSFWTDLWQRLTSFVRDIIAAVQEFIENVLAFGIEQVISMVVKLKELYNFVMDTMMDPAGTVAPILQSIAAKISSEGPAKSQQLGDQWAKENYTGESAQSQDNGTVQRVMIDGEERSTASLWEVLKGILYYLGEAWKGLTFSKILEMLWTSLKDLIWPWSAIGQQFVNLWNDDWTLMYQSLYEPRNFLEHPIGCLHDIWSNFMILLDFPLALWRTLNNVVGLLMGWITIILVLVGAVIGGFGGAAFFGIAIPPGIGAGALAGLALTEPIGLILAGSIISAETTAAEIILWRLFTANQVCEKRQVDIMQTVSSVITAAVTFVVAALMMLLAKLISMIAEFLKGAPKTAPVPEPVLPEPVPAPGQPIPQPGQPRPVPQPTPQPGQPSPVPQPAQPAPQPIPQGPQTPAPPGPVQPVPQGPQGPQPMPPNVTPLFPATPEVPVPANTPPMEVPIAAKFEDDSKGEAKAQLALEENEETKVQNKEEVFAQRESDPEVGGASIV